MARGSRAPPMKARRSTCPRGARVAPLRRDPRTRHDRRPLDAGHDEARAAERVGHGLAAVAEGDRRARRVRNAVAEPRRDRRPGCAPATPPTYAGVQTTTAGAARPLAVFEHDAGTARPRLPPPARRCPAKRSRPAEHASSASTISSRPPGSDMNAPSCEAGCRSWRKARSTLPCFRSASRNRGKSARIDRRSTSPAWMPASSGSAR